MAEVYDTDRFGELYYGSRQPSPQHLFLAANHLVHICTQAAIPYAFMGGWSVRLRGGTRETQDVDITVSTTMEYFKQVVLQMPRVCFPQTHGQTAVNLFVHTGKSFDSGYPDVQDYAVQVDVIISGYLSSPNPIDDTTTEVITSNGFTTRVINIAYLLQGKFNAFTQRGNMNTNDYQDLAFLINKYEAYVQKYNNYINKEHRLVFFRKYAQVYGEHEDETKRMRQTLGLVESSMQQQPSMTYATSNAPAGSRWDGQYHVSVQNSAYIWNGAAWVLRPSTPLQSSQSAASQSTASAPAESRWDGQYFVSTQNPAYVWSGNAWILRPT